MTLSKIAGDIEKNREQLLKTWITAVRTNPRIKSDDELSDVGLRDHVPLVIDEICEVIRKGKAPTPSETHEGRVNAYTRFCQGYRPRDVVSELSLLRVTLIDHVKEQLPNDNFEPKVHFYVDAIKLIDIYIDEELRYAFSIYTEQTV